MLSKKTLYDKLIIKVNAKIASTSGLITKTQHDSNKQSLEKTIEYIDKKIYLIQIG